MNIVLLILLFFFLFGLVLVNFVFRLFRSVFKRTANEKESTNESKERSSKNSKNEEKKVFGKDEGEYVDFEEIKKE